VDKGLIFAVPDPILYFDELSAGRDDAMNDRATVSADLALRLVKKFIGLGCSGTLSPDGDSPVYFHGRSLTS
jgi:hypothetical protein